MSTDLSKLEADLFDRLRHPDLFKDVDPALKGLFWRDWSVEKERGKGIGLSPAVFNCHISSFPYRDIIAATKEFDPSAAGMLDRWATSWERSFPDWEPGRRHDRATAFAQGPVREFEVALHAARKDENLLTVDNCVEKVLRIEAAIKKVMRPGRDKRLDVISDAIATLSCLQSMAGLAVIRINNEVYHYLGPDADGFPIFRKHVEERGSAFVDGFEPRFYDSRVMASHSATVAIKAESLLVASAVAADMAAHGLREVWLISAKRGQLFKLGLQGIRSIDEAKRRIASQIDYSDTRWGYVVTTPSAITFAQRVYVYNGRVVATASFGEHMSSRDAGRHRLDERIVSVDLTALKDGVNEGLPGEVVVDRRLSAVFARQARLIASGLKNEGYDCFSMTLAIVDGRVSVFDITQRRANDNAAANPEWLARAARRAAQSEIEAMLREARERTKIAIPVRLVYNSDFDLGRRALVREYFKLDDIYSQDRRVEVLKRLARPILARDALALHSKQSRSLDESSSYIGRFEFEDSMSGDEVTYVRPVIFEMLRRALDIVPDEIGRFDLERFTDFFLHHSVRTLGHFKYQRDRNDLDNWGGRDSEDILRAILDFRSLNYDICSHFDDLKPDWFLEGPDVEKRKARERKQELRRLERVAASKASGEYDRIMSDLKARRNDIDKKDAHENVEKLDSVDDED